MFYVKFLKHGARNNIIFLNNFLLEVNYLIIYTKKGNN